MGSIGVLRLLVRSPWRPNSSLRMTDEKGLMGECYRRAFFDAFLAAFFATFLGALLAADLVVPFAPRFAAARLAGRMGCMSQGSGTALSAGCFSGGLLLRRPRVFPRSRLFQPVNVFGLLFGHHAKVILDGRQGGSVSDLYNPSW